MATFFLPQTTQDRILLPMGQNSITLGTQLDPGDTHALPAKTKEVFVQNRQCGDVYVYLEREPNVMVSAIGHDRDAAFLAALIKLRQVPA